MKILKIIPIIIVSFISLFVLLSSDASAYLENGHIGLLTVSETANNTIGVGGVADLYLTIKPGSGRIYIDSFPLSRLDTQITMRFASELACDFLQLDCSNLDFFYTIRADSSIVGGPSAGAAATVLTIAMLDDQKINQKTIMTGTINSGYLIGPVAGISEKTFAAQEYGYEKALIPKWDAVNETLIANRTIKIIKVSRIEEALYQFTGKNYTRDYGPVVPSDSYKNIMESITVDLCSKYGSFKNGQIVMPNITGIINQTDNSSLDYFGRAIDAIDKGDYYSAASYCFGGNVRLLTEQYDNLSSRALKQDYATLLGDITLKQEDLSKQTIETMPELETYMIVRERIDDAKQILREVNPDNITASSMAYAKERLDTADSWSKFFDMPGPKFDKNQEVLSTACSKKISETEERINYLEVYYPAQVDRTELNKAYAYSDSKDYALCIFTASKAKAEVDVILGALFVSDKDVGDLLNEKLDAAAAVINRQQESGLFPILGYSYYEYARSLSKDQPYSALLYAEYALELSNLDMYVGVQKEKIPVPYLFDMQNVELFALGFVVGAFLVLAVILAIWAVARNKRMKREAAVSKNARKVLPRKRKRAR